MSVNQAVEIEEKIANAGNENAVHNAELIERAKRKLMIGKKSIALILIKVYVGKAKPCLAFGHSLGVLEEDS